MNTNQAHHFASPKNQKYSPDIKAIADKYGLDLNEKWNVDYVDPHIGRHAYDYHEWVLKQMQEIDQIPNLTTEGFIREFRIRIIQPVMKHPEMLRKYYWKK